MAAKNQKRAQLCPFDDNEKRNEKYFVIHPWDEMWSEKKMKRRAKNQGYPKMWILT
jgi:hypothetical protein